MINGNKYIIKLTRNICELNDQQELKVEFERISKLKPTKDNKNPKNDHYFEYKNTTLVLKERDYNIVKEISKEEPKSKLVKEKKLQHGTHQSEWNKEKQKWEKLSDIPEIPDDKGPLRKILDEKKEVISEEDDALNKLSKTLGIQPSQTKGFNISLLHVLLKANDKIINFQKENERLVKENFKIKTQKDKRYDMLKANVFRLSKIYDLKLKEDEMRPIEVIEYVIGMTEKGNEDGYGLERDYEGEIKSLLDQKFQLETEKAELQNCLKDKQNYIDQIDMKKRGLIEGVKIESKQISLADLIGSKNFIITVKNS